MKRSYAAIRVKLSNLHSDRAWDGLKFHRCDDFSQSARGTRRSTSVTYGKPLDRVHEPFLFCFRRKHDRVTDWQSIVRQFLVDTGYGGSMNTRNSRCDA